MCDICPRQPRIVEFMLPSILTTDIDRQYVLVREVFGDCGKLVERCAVSSVYRKRPVLLTAA